MVKSTRSELGRIKWVYSHTFICCVKFAGFCERKKSSNDK